MERMLMACQSELAAVRKVTDNARGDLPRNRDLYRVLTSGRRHLLYTDEFGSVRFAVWLRLVADETTDSHSEEIVITILSISTLIEDFDSVANRMASEVFENALDLPYAFAFATIGARRETAALMSGTFEDIRDVTALLDFAATLVDERMD